MRISCYHSSDVEFCGCMQGGGCIRQQESCCCPCSLSFEEGFPEDPSPACEGAREKVQWQGGLFWFRVYNGLIIYTFQPSRHKVLLIGVWCRICFWMSLKQTLHFPSLGMPQLIQVFFHWHSFLGVVKLYWKQGNWFFCRMLCSLPPGVFWGFQRREQQQTVPAVAHWLLFMRPFWRIWSTLLKLWASASGFALMVLESCGLVSAFHVSQLLGQQFQICHQQALL